MDEWVLALTGSPWLLLALYGLVVLDGFFPPVPSEGAVIALSALSVATGEPTLWVLGAVAAAGAFTGDQAAYSIGRRIPVRRLRLLRGRRAQLAVDRAERALADRGAAFIIAARYVPVGRVAVNMTAGAVAFSRPRFTGLAAVAAITWSIYSVALGLSAGLWLGEHPLLAAGAGVVAGLLLGLGLDPVLRRFSGGRRGRPVRAAVPVAAAALDLSSDSGSLADA